jgi:putative ABC transport system permease protein
MKSSLYLTYSTRSLLRGGQRTVLALICIAVGIMAVVGLQLAAESMLAAVTTNVRAINQGDVSLTSSTATIAQTDLAFFDQLKQQGVITAYTPERTVQSAVQQAGGTTVIFTSRIVDPATFPLAGPPHLTAPGGGSLAALLQQPGSAVLSQNLADALHVKVGDSVADHTTLGSVTLRVAGIVANDNFTASGRVLDLSAASWTQLSGKPLSYSSVAVATANGGSAADNAAALLRQRFPLGTVQTTADVLKQNQQQVDLIRKFLIVVGLLALLIGGVGIVNTMQVLLQRRRVEIATLKTCGYRRRDLYALFGLEAALLGLAGGVVGSLLGVVVSDALRRLFENATRTILPATFDPLVIVGGVAIGLATALIFGLLPIVRAASVRPQAVLRDLPERGSRTSWLQMAGLVLLLAVLFCLLASVILKSAVWGVIAVVGGLILLSALSLILNGALWLLARLPIPERYSPAYLLLVSGGLVVALAITAIAALRGVGIVFVAFALLGYAAVLLPRGWKVNGRLALRNIGRTRGRTTTTLLALFIGVFTVGVVLVLGQDLSSILTTAFTNANQYNLIAAVPAANAAQMDAALAKLGGVQKHRFSDIAGANPTSVDGQPIGDRIPQGEHAPTTAAQQALALLRGIQGYNLTSGDLPDVAVITAGRNLTPADTDSSNVIVDSALHGAPLRLQAGDTVSLTNPDNAQQVTVTIVGFYKLTASGISISLNSEPIFGSQSLALNLAGANPRGVYYLKVGQANVAGVKSALQQAVPGVFVFDLGDVVALISNVLSNIVVVFTAIGALALVAGVVIVANAVALAMLERRRELGVLKALGYTSSKVLGGVLIENGATAGLGGLLGMVIVAVAVGIFSRVTKASLGVGAPIAILIIGGVVALTTLTAVAVAWGAVRVRPLEVLRYE